MEEAFRAIIKAAAGVTAITSQVDFGRIPQGVALPAIVLQTISDTNTHHMQGPSSLHPGRVQVDCYANTYGGAKVLSRAVLSALDGYKGGNFQGIFHENSRDESEGGTNEVTRPYRVSMDFMTQWSA
jgi:hypothetical protein